MRNIIEIGHLLYVIQVNSSSCIVQKPITWSWPPTLASSSLGPEVLRFSSLEYWMVVCFHVMADPWWSMYYLSGFISIWSFLHDICFKRRGSTGFVFQTKWRSCLLRTLWLVPREGDPRLCTVAVCSVGVCVSYCTVWMSVYVSPYLEGQWLAAVLRQGNGVITLNSIITVQFWWN